MSIRTIVRLALAAFGLGAPVLHAQTAGTIAGRVTSATTGTPLSGVFIFVDGTAPRAQTDAEGSYRVAGIPVGKRNVEARRGTATATTVVEGSRPARPPPQTSPSATLRRSSRR